MTNYSNKTGSVRVDFFKPGGKWYMTEDLDMSDYWHKEKCSTPIAAVLMALKETTRHGKDGKTPNEFFTIVVLEPYHEFSYPVCIPSMKLKVTE